MSGDSPHRKCDVIDHDKRRKAERDSDEIQYEESIQEVRESGKQFEIIGKAIDRHSSPIRRWRATRTSRKPVSDFH
jgi:hypothetical protein